MWFGAHERCHQFAWIANALWWNDDIFLAGMAEGDGACVGVGVGLGISSQILLYYLLKLAWFAGKKVADKLKAKTDV